jgi:hypothetical protein
MDGSPAELVTAVQSDDPNTLKETNSKPILFITVFLGILAYIFGSAFVQIGEQADWNKIRCQPHIMPFASLYGHNTSDNFNYCMKSTFDVQAKEYLGPVYATFGGFVGVLSTLVEISKKIKLAFATMFGGVVTIMSEFTERIKIFFVRIEILAQRMRMMMNRIYATMYAVIFMAMSGLTAVTNFGGTVLFDVIDTFCFDPSTLIETQNRGILEIADVQLGDVLSDGGRVTSVFRFIADGQAMVELPRSGGSSKPVLVSTNHYILHNGQWIRADAHPAARPAAVWSGGTSRPLICLNTTTNCIPIAEHLFRDYDETSVAHKEAIEYAHYHLNGRQQQSASAFGSAWKELLPAVAPNTLIRLRDGSCRRSADLQLGDIMTTGDVIAGRIQHIVTEICELPAGAQVAAGALIFNPATNLWQRCGDLYPVRTVAPTVFESFITLPGSRLELASGVFLRDYLEIASKDTEGPYAAALAALGAVPSSPN